MEHSYQRNEKYPNFSMTYKRVYKSSGLQLSSTIGRLVTSLTVGYMSVG